MCVPGALRGQNRILGFPGVGVIDDYEPPCGFWESNPGSLQEQQGFLTTETSQQPHSFLFILIMDIFIFLIICLIYYLNYNSYCYL